MSMTLEVQQAVLLQTGPDVKLDNIQISQYLSCQCLGEAACPSSFYTLLL